MRYFDPTREEMLDLLARLVPESDDFDRESAIYWFASDYHSGQWSNLYSALSTSPYRPGALESGADPQSECYDLLVDRHFDTL